MIAACLVQQLVVAPSVTSISNRARQLIGRPPLAPYVRAHIERLGAAESGRTEGLHYIPLCIAENRWLWPELSDRLAAVPEGPHRLLGYDAMVGSASFRAQLATFLSKWVFGRPVTADQLAALAGAGTVLEVLFYALADAGQGVLVPTPSYAGFWPDLQTRDDLTVVPVPTRSSENFELTADRLDRALAASSVPIRALLYTNPDNPLGRVAPPDRVRSVLEWAEQAGIHVVCDEVYALSVYGETPFVSAAALRPVLGDHVHVVWAFSKDFGASGLRCGVLLSENEEVQRAVQSLAYWCACSGHTQYLLGEVVSDGAWLHGYLSLQRDRLGAGYRAVAERLQAHRIPHVAADAGIFVLCDLRAAMSAPTFAAEDALWRRLLDEANVNLTPGSACRIAEPGFFRLCWAGIPLPEVLQGIDRVGAVLMRPR